MFSIHTSMATTRRRSLLSSSIHSFHWDFGRRYEWEQEQVLRSGSSIHEHKRRRERGGRDGSGGIEWERGDTVHGVVNKGRKSTFSQLTGYFVHSTLDSSRSQDCLRSPYTRDRTPVRVLPLIRHTHMHMSYGGGKSLDTAAYMACSQAIGGKQGLDRQHESSESFRAPGYYGRHKWKSGIKNDQLRLFPYEQRGVRRCHRVQRQLELSWRLNSAYCSTRNLARMSFAGVSDTPRHGRVDISIQRSLHVLI